MGGATVDTVSFRGWIYTSLRTPCHVSCHVLSTAAKITGPSGDRRYLTRLEGLLQPTGDVAQLLNYCGEFLQTSQRRVGRMRHYS